ncbi:MAG: DUF6252 family protein [Bacteroidales bacterium]|nr:DUF6252 family protein [Bacteroidales bacterium]
MRKIIIVLTALLVFGACDDDDIKELLPEMSATIDGAEWNTITRVTTFNKGQQFVIVGTSFAGEILTLYIYGNEAKEYELTLEGGKNCAAGYKASASDSADDIYAGVTGKINLSEINTDKKTISGTFEFTMTKLTETIKITGGKFSKLRYTETDQLQNFQ